jgi:DNA-binding beta-propeller fold protein YncE
LVLTFSTQGLVAASNDATVAITRGASSLFLSVKAQVSAASIVGLVDDPIRSRTYGLHRNGLGLGALVVFDPLQESYLGCVTLGNKPGDIAISPDGQEMLVICSASKSIAAINLAQCRVTETIPLEYGDWGSNDTTAHIQYGPGNILYYTDGNWAPMLRVFDRSTRTVKQALTTDSLPGASYSYGFGDIAVTPDRTALFAWASMAGPPD